MVEFKNKNILVLGLRTSGVHVIQLFNKKGIFVYMTDQKIKKEQLDIDCERNTYIDHNQAINRMQSFDMLIKSPGIPDDVPIMKEAVKQQVTIYSEVEVAYQFFPKDKVLIGITGTNGKTTTTSMIAHLLNHAGIRAVSCGNIGYTFSEAILQQEAYDVFVCELSSFQLQYIRDFKPFIKVLLNISPNHLDYHKTFENYIKAKLNILNESTKEDYLVFNEDDAVIKEWIQTYSVSKVNFSLQDQTATFYLKDDVIYYRQTPLIDTTQLQVLGKENIANMMGALNVCKLLGIEDHLMQNAMYQFKPLEYRIEYVDTYQGVHFYNDSKSTNAKATYCAIEAVGKPIILILGGVYKEDDYQAVMTHEGIKFIISYGQNKQYLKEQADRYNQVCFVCENLLEVMRLLRKIMIKGDTVLFSPAAQSFDQYENYIKRGEDFSNLLNTVIKF